jgi:hypothetical protein
MTKPADKLRIDVDNESDDDDDDDDDEVGVASTLTEMETIDRRDEVGEVRKMSSKDTNRLRLWRIVVTIVILITAFVVTLTTYTLLERQESENFQTAVCLFHSHSRSFNTTSGIVLSFLYALRPDINILYFFFLVCTICPYRWRCCGGPTTRYA